MPQDVLEWWIMFVRGRLESVWIAPGLDGWAGQPAPKKWECVWLRWVTGGQPPTALLVTMLVGLADFADETVSSSGGRVRAAYL